MATDDLSNAHAASGVPVPDRARAGAATAATDLGSEHPFGPHAASILATEHWSLLGTRSLIWNEAMSRTTVFLTVLSASIIALVLLPIVLLLGIATYLVVAAAGR